MNLFEETEKRKKLAKHVYVSHYIDSSCNETEAFLNNFYLMIYFIFLPIAEKTTYPLFSL